MSQQISHKISHQTNNQIEKNWQIKAYRFVLKQLEEDQITKPSKHLIETLVNTFFQKNDVFLPEKTKNNILDEIVFSINGFGPLEFYLRDDSVSEIMVNGFEKIYIEKSGKLVLSERKFMDDAQVIQVINRMVSQIGRRIDESQPLVDGRLPDGSRINAIIPPLALNGPTLTIRKFPTKVFGLPEMLAHNSINKAMSEFITTSVLSGKNILISGGTGAGKTSTLNAFASLIPKSERIITIEDSAEIRIDHPHCISLESRNANIEGKGQVSIRNLLKNALRMRPDRIVVGEIRGGEAIDMLQAMNTGHQGSLTTLHANAPLESLMRLETMVLMGGIDLPISAIRPQIIQAIDIVVQQERLSSGHRKITKISLIKKSVQETDNFKNYQLQDCFVYDPKTDQFISKI